MLNRLGLCVLALLLSVGSASAQVIINFAQSRVEFTSTDHDTIVPAGQVGAGGPVILTYQALVLLTAADPVAGNVIFTSAPIPRTAVTTISGVSPNQTFSLTFLQLGITAAVLPACTVVAPATCPAYSVILLTSGPAGTSARSLLAESDSFSLAALVLPAKPAPPSLVKVKAS